MDIEDLTLNLDISGDEKFIDIPSPDGTRAFTTLNDMCSILIDEPSIKDEMCMGEEVVFSDYEDDDEFHTVNDVTLPMVIHEQKIKIENESEIHPKIVPDVDVIKQECFGDGYEEEISADYSALIPTTVEAANTSPENIVRYPNSKIKKISTLSQTQTTPHDLRKVNKNPLVHQSQKPGKHSSKRPVAAAGRKGVLLWQFLLNILHNASHNPSIMTWIDYKEGIFKIVQSQSLAKLWGVYRNKTTGVKYEFFARAMRHYYRQKIIRRIPGRKLVYQFGEKIDWKNTNEAANRIRRTHVS